MSKTFYLAFGLSLFCCVLAVLSAAQTGQQTPAPDLPGNAKRALDLAKMGHCREALPLLVKSAARLADKDLKRNIGFAGVRCSMFADQPDAAIDFLRLLNREFPHDPDVLYLSVHTYSDLSTRASSQLANSAPTSYQSQELSAEALEVQGKWDEAANIYRQILKQNPNLAGIHYRLGRVLVSKPEFGPVAAEEAKHEFEKELQIDSANAGAEYVLGEIAKQQQQWDDAIQHFSHAARLDASFGDAFVGWGGSLVEVKKFSDAVAPLETAVKLEAKNPAAHYLLAIAYARSGRKEDGEKEFAIHRSLVGSDSGAAEQPASAARPQ